MVEIYEEILADQDKFKGYYDWGSDTDRILDNYPLLTIPEAIVISAFLERSYKTNDFAKCLKDFGVK